MKRSGDGWWWLLRNSIYLKMAEVGNFMLHLFYHNWKNSGISALPEQGSFEGSMRGVLARFLGQCPARGWAGFVGLQPGRMYRAPVLRPALQLLQCYCSYVKILKF